MSWFQLWLAASKHEHLFTEYMQTQVTRQVKLKHAEWNRQSYDNLVWLLQLRGFLDNILRFCCFHRRNRTVDGRLVIRDKPSNEYGDVESTTWNQPQRWVWNLRIKFIQKEGFVQQPTWSMPRKSLHPELDCSIAKAYFIFHIWSDLAHSTAFGTSLEASSAE